MSGIKDRMSAFASFVWNGEEKTFLGRGGRSWAEIGVFYLIYYICLGCFFVGMLTVFYKTLDTDRPKLVGESSLLKGNPGMGFKPMPDVEYTLVRFEKNPDTYMPLVDSIKKLLKPYKEAEKRMKEIMEKKQNGEWDGKEPELVDCDVEGYKLEEDQSCYFNLTKLTAKCNEENKFGYAGKDRKPCILMRLNRIFGWMPQKFNADNINDAVHSPELREKILGNPDMIWVDCVGENPADRDNLGEVEYFPQQGFSFKYYPFENQKDYMSPLVFVRFSSPERMMALMVECRALAPNIHYDRNEKEGGVHFELLADY